MAGIVNEVKWGGTFRSDQSKWPDRSKWTTFKGGTKYAGRTEPKWSLPFCGRQLSNSVRQSDGAFLAGNRVATCVFWAGKLNRKLKITTRKQSESNLSLLYGTLFAEFDEDNQICFLESRWQLTHLLVLWKLIVGYCELAVHLHSQFKLIFSTEIIYFDKCSLASIWFWLRLK